jgi:two-component system, chemotaxis family, response regulator PixG
MNPFDIVQLLKDSVQRPHGIWQISCNSVTWQIGLSNGQLNYAYNTLQSLDLLEQFLPELGFESSLPGYREIIQSQPDLRLIDAIGQMLDRQVLAPHQAQQLTRAIAQDALDPLLWSSAAQAEWQEAPITPGNLPGISITEFVGQFEPRLNLWKSLAPTIVSPYQRPRCLDFSRLQQPVPQGVLPAQTLEMIARLMQGISLRQLAFLLKQDSLKVCQMLHPYIAAGILQLEDATHPHHTLPTIPAATPAPAAFSTSTGIPIAATVPTTSFTSNSNSASGPKYKVVCIDDSPTVLDTIQRYLGTDRFEIATVENPMASLSALFDMKPDLILMDVSMPGIDGNRLCQILKRSSVFTEVPIIMVSGNSGVLDKEKAKAAGATDYLTKPFSQEELLNLVNQYLKQQPAYI